MTVTLFFVGYIKIQPKQLMLSFGFLLFFCPLIKRSLWLNWSGFIVRTQPLWIKRILTQCTNGSIVYRSLIKREVNRMQGIIVDAWSEFVWSWVKWLECLFVFSHLIFNLFSRVIINVDDDVKMLFGFFSLVRQCQRIRHSQPPDWTTIC